MKMRVFPGCVALAFGCFSGSIAGAVGVGLERGHRCECAAWSSGSGPGQNVSATVPVVADERHGVVARVGQRRCLCRGRVHVGAAARRSAGNRRGAAHVPGGVQRQYGCPDHYLRSGGQRGGRLRPEPPVRVTALAVSPDGSTLYAGGDFTGVNGSYRGYLAAFSTSTGALVSTWKPTAATGRCIRSRRPQTDRMVYVGGELHASSTASRATGPAR